MLCRNIHLYFNRAGERISASGEDGGDLPAPELYFSDLFQVTAHFCSVAESGGALVVTPAALDEGAEVELRGSDASGGVLFSASGTITGVGTVTFMADTATPAFQAASRTEGEYFMTVCVLSEGTSPRHLGTAPFVIGRDCDWTLTPPEAVPPEFLAYGTVRGLWQSAVEFEFSEDGVLWHPAQSPDDLLLRVKRPGGGAGTPVAIPAAGEIAIDASGSAAERPAAGDGACVYLNDETGQVSVSDGVSWSDWFSFTGPRGRDGKIVVVSPPIMPCALTPEGALTVTLGTGSETAVLLQPLQLPLRMVLRLRGADDSAGFAELAVVGSDGTILARERVQIFAGGEINTVSLDVPGSGFRQLRLRRLTEEPGDTLPGAVEITAVLLEVPTAEVSPSL